jgi:hypothetical protein
MKKSAGKGHFTATPLEFQLDGKTYTYAGRGRWSVQLATRIATDKKAPVKAEDGTWTWRDATPSELASAEKLTAKVAKSLEDKAAKATARIARKAAKGRKKATEEVPVEAAAEVAEAAPEAAKAGA